MQLLYFSLALVCYMISILGRLDRYYFIDRYGRLFRRRAVAFLLIIIILIIFSGFRHLSKAVVDEYAYRNRFDYFSSVPLKTALEHSGEYFTSLVFWIASRISDNSQYGLLISSIIIIIPIAIAFYRYSIDFSFAILMLFAGGTLFSSFNGIAQYMSAAVYLLSIKYIYEKKLLKYTICVVVCMMFHNAAVVLYPLYFILTSRPKTVKSFLVYFSIMLIMITAYRSLGFIIDKTGMLSDYASIAQNGHHGVRFVRIAVSVVPALLVLFMKKEKSDDVTNIVANMCILHAVIMIVSTLDVYIARFAIFTEVFIIIFYSRIFNIILERNKTIIKIIVVFLYCIVTYITMGEAQYEFIPL